MNRLFNPSASFSQKPKALTGVLALLFMLFSSSGINAQRYQVGQQNLVPENLEQMKKKENSELAISAMFDRVEGTYQIQCFKEGYKVLRTEALYQKIVSLRKEDEDVYVQLDEYSRLYLPSKKAVGLAGYKKIECISYISK